jgi:ceramide glucosyltransferase
MSLKIVEYAVLGMALFPFFYYLLVLYSTWKFFRAAPRSVQLTNRAFTPPISILKPVRGLDPEAYENFASFCRQDYPEYEIVFCIGDTSDPTYPTLEKIVRDFPERQIRVLIGSSSCA